MTHDMFNCSIANLFFAKDSALRTGDSWGTDRFKTPTSVENNFYGHNQPASTNSWCGAIGGLGAEKKENWCGVSGGLGSGVKSEWDPMAGGLKSDNNDGWGSSGLGW